MFRWLSSLLLGLAAFDVALPFLDRPGTAALGLSVAALAIPRRRAPVVSYAPDVLGELGSLDASPLSASLARVLGTHPGEPLSADDLERSRSASHASPPTAA